MRYELLAKGDRTWSTIQHLIFSMGDGAVTLVPTHPALYRHQPSHIKSTRFAVGLGSKYIPNGYLGCTMKVQKIVSLDVETAELASRMTNFSAFVRASLRAEAVGLDIASESARRARWARTCSTLAQIAYGYALAQAKANDEELQYDGWEDLMMEVFNQATLEDFE